MTKNGFKVMDSDMHLLEPTDLWQKHIDAAFRERAPVGLTRHLRDLGVQGDGKVLPKPRQQSDARLAEVREQIIKEKYSDVAARDFDNVSQLWAMDKEGVDVAVLYPSRGLVVLAIDGLDPEFAAAIARAYNLTASRRQVSARGRDLSHPALF